MDFIQLDFEQAKTRLLLFKTRLSSIAYGAEPDDITAESSTASLLGKWLYEYALEQYNMLPQMMHLQRLYTRFYTTGQQIADARKLDTGAELHAALQRLSSISDQMISLLDEAEQAARNLDIAPPAQDYSTRLTINYTELLEVTRIVNSLDERIKEQTARSAKAARIALEYEGKFRNIVMQAPVGITILTGRDMVVEMANTTYLQIVDRTEAEFVGRSLYDSLPEVRDTVEPVLLNVFNTGITYEGNEFEVTLNRFGSREQTYFTFVYQPLRQDDGAVTGVIVVATEVTRQVHAKYALQESEAQFRNFINQSPIAMTIFRGPDHIIEIANETLLKNLWRRERHEVIGKPALEVFPELKTQQYPKLLQDVLQNGTTHQQKEALAYVDASDGRKTYYLDFEYAPLHAIDGSVSGVFITVYDVTEKVEARKKSEEAEKRFRDLIETLPVAVYTTDLQGDLNLYNKAALDLWGRTPAAGEKWCGSTAMYTTGGNKLQPEDFHIRQAIKNDRTLREEAYIERPDGSLRHVIVNPRPIHDIDGRVIGALNVLVDITERRETELALRISEAKFRLLADSMPQLIWTADTKGNLDYFSQSVYDYSGLTPGELETQGWLSIVHPDDRNENIDLWMQSVNTGQDFHFEHRFKRYDGEYRWQLSRAVPQRDVNGDIRMWVGTSTDIHDRKLFMDELESKVQQRTHELEQANEQLLRTNTELAQFAYVASHDLQEPLRKIQTFATRILESESTLSDKNRDYFNRMQASSLRMQQLITDLLSFSRSSTVEQHFKETDLNELLQNVKDQLSDKLEQTKAHIISMPLPVISIINYQFEQLVTNIIANSLKFVREGVPPVINIFTGTAMGGTIGLPGMRSNQLYHRITISDNGIGFEPQYAERIFQVFQRLHGKSAYEGTGIGLAICKKIVENHKGFITAVGKPGEGAAFTIYLPAGQPSS